MMHVCFQDTCIHDAYIPDACIHDAYIYDPDGCVHDARMYVAFIHDPRSLTLMLVCMMHIPMILDPDACIYDAANLSRTNGRTRRFQELDDNTI